jgi:hypothetical protein
MMPVSVSIGGERMGSSGARCCVEASRELSVVPSAIDGS